MIIKSLKTAAKAMLGFRLPGTSIARGPDQLLVVIFLRGGADGLSMVSPFADDAYYRNRVLTAIPSPSAGFGLKMLDLDGFYGLHPSLSGLYPYFRSGELGFVHACGSGDVTLSHFAASNTVERGLYQESGDSTGWLARYLDAMPAGRNSPLKAVAIGSLLPASLGGASTAMAVQNIRDLLISSPFTGGNAEMQSALSGLYSGGGDLARDAGGQTLDLIKVLRLAPEQPHANRSYSDDDLGSGLRQIASLASSNTGLTVACIDQSGYDTHVVQGGTVGNLADCLTNLSKSLVSFVEDLGEQQWRKTKVIVISEFGRRVRENDGAGTDHGHGNVMMVLGGAGVNGGHVHGKWLGLDNGGVDQNGNLRVTTDYRNVLAEVIGAQIGVTRAATVFPDLAFQKVGIVYA